MTPEEMRADSFAYVERLRPDVWNGMLEDSLDLVARCVPGFTEPLTEEIRAVLGAIAMVQGPPPAPERTTN